MFAKRYEDAEADQHLARAIDRLSGHAMAALALAASRPGITLDEIEAAKAMIQSLASDRGVSEEPSFSPRALAIETLQKASALIPKSS